MTQANQQNFTMELSRRTSQDMSEPAPTLAKGRSDAGLSKSCAERPPAVGESANAEDKTEFDYGAVAAAAAAVARESKNPFLPQVYRASRPHGHFEMGPRGVDYSPHRMGFETSGRARDLGPQRSSSVQGHELTEPPPGVAHRAYFGNQLAHPDLFRHEYYAQMGFSPPRASRFSSQEYLNAPAQFGRWPDYRAEYRHRRRSQQDLLAIERNAGAETGTSVP
ncbi:uncharacterized protein LOC113238962 [Hyposmocoma kahamanoa]|uniref:uncharacterized protein LOC113238962 n=1 Tax=Hyposmocoma kahamanoa TaxID=1477025 RepID=UPI000E6D7E38|nr:uncharacterized protein LOC113238962 [Hyposmocoma kahamanoa]